MLLKQQKRYKIFNMAEQKRNLNEKNVILAWQLWVLARMRFLLGRNCVISDNNLRYMKDSLTKRMDGNWQRMATDPRNRDAKGLFCMNRAQHNMLLDLNDKELADLLKFIENFEVTVRDQKIALMKGKRALNIDAAKEPTKESTRNLSEKNVLLGWQLWTMARMRYMLGQNCTLTDGQLGMMKTSLMKRMDANWQNMIANPRNRNSKGQFCMNYAQQNLLSTASEKELDDLANFMYNLEMNIREQKRSLTSVKLKIRNS